MDNDRKNSAHLDCHGVTHIQQAKYPKHKIFWSFLLLICTIIGIYTCVMVTVEYSATPTATRIKLNQVNSLLLPRLTLCPSSADAFELELLSGYLKRKLPPGELYMKRDLIAYILAGFGFQKMEAFARNWNVSMINHLDYLYKELKQNKTQMEFFTYFFDRFGFKCDQLFDNCEFGGKRIKCCSKFIPTFNIRRGKCFALKPINQTIPDELGKLRLYLKQVPSLFEKSGYHPNIVVYVGDHKNDIAPYPRYYLNKGDIQKIRLSVRRLNLMPHVNLCINKRKWKPKVVKYETKGGCNIERWVKDSLVDHLNCTLPYIEMVKPEPICPSKLFVLNYESAIDSSYRPQKACRLACNRWEYKLLWEFQKSSIPFYGYSFHLALSYTDLQFEELTEITTVTFFGFVSQIGGQLGLFVGGSVITLAQIFIVFSVYIRRRCVKDTVAIAAK